MFKNVACCSITDTLLPTVDISNTDTTDAGNDALDSLIVSPNSSKLITDLVHMILTVFHQMQI